MKGSRRIPGAGPIAAVIIVNGALGVLALGCGDRRDPLKPASSEDTVWGRRRRDWVYEQTAAKGWFLRSFLNGNRDIQYFDGWYTPEFDPKTGAVWRWMEKRAIVRLRTRIENQTELSDMSLTIHGWVPWQDMDTRTSQMELAVNGRVLDHFDPPRENFQHTIVVPRWLLERSEFVDLAITVANTARPRGDWRDIGFCTTGVVWKPVSSS